MKSILLVLALSIFAMSFVAANGSVDTVVMTDDAIEVSEDQEVADVSEEVEAAAKAKKAEVAFQDEESCCSCK
jgi:hypothetical protein